MANVNNESPTQIGSSRVSHKVPPGRRTRRPLRRRLVRGAALLGVLALLTLASAAWLGLKAAAAKAELQNASELLPQLQDEVFRKDAEAATQTVNVLKMHTAKARDATRDPLWTLAGALPWIGSNFQAATEVSTTADDVARLGAAPLVSVLQSLDWNDLTPQEGGINAEPLSTASPALLAAANAVEQSSDRLNGINSSALLPQISGPLVQAQEQLASLRGNLRTAADVAALAPTMLGSEQPRHYLLLVENNAESRATGGIPGALAVLSVDRGKLSLDSQSSASQLGIFTPPMTLDSEQQQIYSARLGKFMQDVNLTPDFPSGAVTAQAMWEKKFGQRVDGVISIDPVALSYILEVTGPLQLSDPTLIKTAGNSLPTELTAKNVVPTLLSDVYGKIAQPELQDVYFAGVAKEVFAELSSGKGDRKGMIEGVAKGAEERRIKVWSAHAAEQSVIARYPLGGSISGPSVAPAEFGVYFNDGTGAKMDYYVQRSVQLVKECAVDGYEQTTVRITSTNLAPADAATSLPVYVTGDGSFGVPPGSVQTNLVAYGPVQANIETTKLDGQKTDFAPYIHSNRPVGVLAIRLAPGESRTVEFTFGKIVQHTEPNLVVTPTVQDVNDVILPTQEAMCG